ncbi:YciI family protein [Herbiconiux flava]|uniref:YCII-related domain-containing protein n=1 Tax=Herbiconiux flava TaxID=881268 RepID=A0A852SMK1_9MICO|nr:YciI family protein [Herbiconiux flava]NYD70038.1 hypothetical protein [Herbiconiux flava]GLK16788.1 hypothetical protein GCM10017602_12700 [Herbiconiux flava]
MKVMLMMWSDGSYAGGGSAEDYAAWADYGASLRDDGIFVASGQFAEAGGGVSITTDPSTPDGPAGTTPARAGLVGYYLLDCSSHDEAVRAARRAPLYGSVEVRELAKY